MQLKNAAPKPKPWKIGTGNATRWARWSPSRSRAWRTFVKKLSRDQATSFGTPRLPDVRK